MDDFYRSHAPSETPWPFAILEWEPEHEAPTLVLRLCFKSGRIRGTSSNSRRIPVGQTAIGLVRTGRTRPGFFYNTQGQACGLRIHRRTALRHECVASLETAVTDGLAHPRHLAHTVDGIRIVEGDPPLYAVLSDAFASDEDGFRLTPGLDVDEVDSIRHAVGLLPVLRT